MLLAQPPANGWDASGIIKSGGSNSEVRLTASSPLPSPPFRMEEREEKTQRRIGFLSVALSGPIRLYPWSTLSVMPQSLPEILSSTAEIKSIEADTGGARGLVKQPLVNLDQIGCGLFWTKLR